MLHNTTSRLLGVFLILFLANKTLADDANQQFVDEINEMRRTYAKKYNVPNMYKLYWSDDLAKMVHLSWDKNSKWTSAKVASYDGISKEIESDMESFLKTGKTSDRLRFVAPLQKYVGCEMETKKICLIGPENALSLWSFGERNDEEYDEFGTDCQKGYENDDGLCALIDKTKALYFGSPEDFVVEVNSVRRKYAKQYHVPDMHELTWSDELAAIAEPLNYADSWPQARETWRYSWLRVYYIAAEEIESDVNWCLENPEKAKSWIASNINKFVGELEFLVPQQTKIGCVRKFDPTESFVVCLLGPTGTFTMINLDENSQEVAGSKCLDGYEDNNGLCAYVPTTEAPLTEAPTTEAPLTEPPTTEAPLTEPPTTEAPPPTEAPTTEAPPPTEAPTTEAPLTEVPTTEAPPTVAPPAPPAQHQRPQQQQQTPQEPQKQSSSADSSETPAESEEEADPEASISVLSTQFLPFILSSIFLMI